jgi:hypothetical protein
MPAASRDSEGYKVDLSIRRAISSIRVLARPKNPSAAMALKMASIIAGTNCPERSYPLARNQTVLHCRTAAAGFLVPLSNCR